VRLSKFSLRYAALLYLLLVLSCNDSSTKEIDLNHLSEAEKQHLITRVQEEVDNKIPFQGSWIHQYKCDTLIALNHNIFGALQEKATPSTKVGDYHIAFPLLEKAADVDPKGALYYYSWLLLYYYRDYERALERLTQFDDFTPNEPDVAWGENVNYLKGLAYKQLGKYPEAIQEFSKAIADEGKNVDLYAYVYRGIAHLHNDDIALAMKDFNMAIDDYDKCTTAYYWKAEAFIKKGDKKNALLMLQKAQDLLAKGYYKSDPYMEFFDIPVKEQIADKIAELSL